jgi:saccharopine dehydrogenase-like NADP-dependent oxidoreductase
MKHVLVLGAGRVARPCVQYLQKLDWVKLTVVEAVKENLERVAGSHPRTATLNQSVPKDASAFIAAQKPDLVINLLVAESRNQIAADCLKAGANLVFPAYADDSIKAMEPQLKEGGRTWLFELGLDPGIDHMSAAKVVNAIHARGGQVESFRSVCGAIPSAEANTNPWGYKLSWAPDALIGASRRTCKFMADDKVVEWLDGATYEHAFLEEVPDMGCYEVYANGDSIPYLKGYNIPEARSIFRGTYRYVGWAETIVSMNQLDLFSLEPADFKGLTFQSFIARQCGAARSADVEAALCARLGLKPCSAVILRLKWLGFLEDRPVPASCGCHRDLVRFLYAERLVYTPQERDLIVLKDEVVAFFPATGKRELHTSTLIDFGVPGGDSAIARTTGLPPAIAARLFLEGKIRQTGIVYPTLPDLYEPSLAELEREGIRMAETVVPL